MPEIAIRQLVTDAAGNTEVRYQVDGGVVETLILSDEDAAINLQLNPRLVLWLMLQMGFKSAAINDVKVAKLKPWLENKIFRY